MKRHGDLRDLSEDHHHALVLARRARRAARGEGGWTVERAWADALHRFEAELAPHFAAEEAALLPALVAAGEVDLAARVEREHAELRAAVREGAPRDAAALESFGLALERHVRFEEREAFERAQQVLDAAALERVRAARAGAGVRRVACELPPRGAEGAP